MQASPSTILESALVVRVEPGYLVANLYERLGDRLRLAGRGVTLGVSPASDHADALIQALGSIERATGRRLLRNGVPVLPQTPDRRGVDVITAVVRTVGGHPSWGVVTTGARLPETTLEHLAGVAGSPPLVTLSLAGDEIKRPPAAAAMVGELFARPLDALVIVGDPGGRFDEPQQHFFQMIAAASSVLPTRGDRPALTLLIGGDAMLAARLRPLLGSRAGVIEVGPLVGRDGALDGGERAALLALSDAFGDIQRRTAPAALTGFDRLSGWLETPALMAREAARLGAVAAAHVAGVSTLRLFDASLPPEVADVAGGLARGRSARGNASLLAPVDEPAATLVPKVLRAASPWSVPTTPVEAWHHALWLKSLLGRIEAAPAQIEALVMTGTRTLAATSAAGAVLAGLTTAGVPGLYSLWNDGGGALADAAALAALSPAAADEVVSGALTRVGSAVVASAGGLDPLKVDVQHAEGYRVSLEVPPGELEVLPLEPNLPARIVARPAGRVDVGAGPGRPVESNVRGSELGLIVDNRASGEPEKVDAQTVARWLRGLRGQAPALDLSRQLAAPRARVGEAPARS